MKSIILFIIFICCLIFTSFTKNNTRTVEKKIAILNHDIKILEKELAKFFKNAERVEKPEIKGYRDDADGVIKQIDYYFE